MSTSNIAFEIAASAVKSALAGKNHFLPPEQRIAIVEDLANKIVADDPAKPWMRDRDGTALLDGGEFVHPHVAIRRMVETSPEKFGVKSTSKLSPAAASTAPAAMTAQSVTNLMVKARQGDSAACAQLDAHLKKNS